MIEQLLAVTATLVLILAWGYMMKLVVKTNKEVEHKYL